MSREAAGAALRGLRESRDWSLADLAAATGVSVMGLSFLERGARKPHKGTVQKVENGKVYTVEGNSGDSCRVNEYSIGYYEILGYGAPAY